jgi:hypothetical protein
LFGKAAVDIWADDLGGNLAGTATGAPCPAFAMADASNLTVS